MFRAKVASVRTIVDIKDVDGSRVSLESVLPNFHSKCNLWVKTKVENLYVRRQVVVDRRNSFDRNGTSINSFGIYCRDDVRKARTPGSIARFLN